MDALTYCRLYKVPTQLAGLMQYMKPLEWWVFSSKKVINTNDNYIIITTGYYTGSGPDTRRMSMQKVVLEACVKSGYRFSAYNDSPRKGAKGEKVKIYLPLVPEKNELKLEKQVQY